MLQLIKTNSIIALKRMQSTQVIDNDITYEKIYNKLVENKNGFMQDILEVNKSMEEALNNGYALIWCYSVDRNYIEEDITSWDKVTNECLKQRAIFLHNLYLRKQLRLHPYMLIIP